MTIESVKKRLETMRKKNNFYRPFGDKNPMKNRKTAEIVRQKLSGRKLSKEHKENMSKSLKGKSYEELMGKEKSGKLKRLRHIMNSNENNPNWLGGLTKEESDENNTSEFRELVRKRDNQICMVCGIHREKLKRTLDIHHIDYNKLNTIPRNCISLCHSCHQKTNFNRRHWFDMLKNIMSERYHYEYSEPIKIIKFEEKEVKFHETQRMA